MKTMLLILLLICTTISAQTPYNETFQKSFFKGQYPQLIPVLFRTYPVYEADSTYKVVMNVQLQYNYLQFLHEGGDYSAGVEFDVGFRHRETRKIVSKIWRTEFKVDDFETTHSRRRYHFAADTILLPVGEYDISFKYKDAYGQKRLAFRQQISLPKIDQFFFSPPLFLYSNRENQSSLTGAENQPSSLMQNWVFNKDMDVYYEIWRTDSSAAVPLEIELINAEDGSTMFQMDTILTNGSNRQSLEIALPVKQFREGAYRLQTVYKTERDSTRKIIPFNLVWFDKPISLWDMELAIQPLQYILDPDQYKYINKGGKEDRIKKFDAFWAEQDPTPDSPYNELQREFYTRVDSALSRFSTKKRLGWKTDLGKIYISQGPPDRVEDHSLDPRQPHLKWIYLAEEKRYTYIFRAVDGRKEYELIDSQESSL